MFWVAGRHSLNVVLQFELADDVRNLSMEVDVGWNMKYRTWVQLMSVEVASKNKRLLLAVIAMILRTLHTLLIVVVICLLVDGEINHLMSFRISLHALHPLKNILKFNYLFDSNREKKI